MQTQFACRRFHVVPNEAGPVCGQAIENQADRPPSSIHQLPQQRDEQFIGQTVRVGTEPELAPRSDRRGGRYLLALPWPNHDRRLAAQPAHYGMDRALVKARLIPKQDLCAFTFSLTGKRRIGLWLPQGNRFRIPLTRTLRRQLQLRQQRADRTDAQRNPELALDQQRHDRARPQSEIQSLQTRSAAVDPAQHLPLLRRRQAARTPDAAGRTQSPQALAAAGDLAHPLVNRLSVESAGADHRHGILAFAHAAARHEPYLFEGGMIERTAVHSLYRTRPTPRDSTPS